MSQTEPHTSSGESSHTASSAGADGADGRRRSSGDGPMGRLANESRALFDDLREWVDLRVQLVQVEVEERVERAANEIISLMVVAVMALFAFSFLLHGVAVWIGTALGGTHWGYLIVAAFLALLTIVLRKARPNHVRRVASLYRADIAEEDDKRIQPSLPPAAGPGVGGSGSAEAEPAGWDEGHPGQEPDDSGNEDVTEGNEQGGKDRG